MAPPAPPATTPPEHPQNLKGSKKRTEREIDNLLLRIPLDLNSINGAAGKTLIEEYFMLHSNIKVRLNSSLELEVLHLRRDALYVNVKCYIPSRSYVVNLMITSEIT